MTNRLHWKPSDLATLFASIATAVYLFDLKSARGSPNSQAKQISGLMRSLTAQAIPYFVFRNVLFECLEWLPKLKLIDSHSSAFRTNHNSVERLSPTNEKAHYKTYSQENDPSFFWFCFVYLRALVGLWLTFCISKPVLECPYSGVWENAKPEVLTRRRCWGQTIERKHSKSVKKFLWGLPKRSVLTVPL